MTPVWPSTSWSTAASGATTTPTITTGVYGTNNDALNAEQGYSTRTGYYMRKLLRAKCNVDPSVNTTQNHVTARIRFTEIYLAYAEAANEAWGPTDSRKGYSAYDVIKAIRSRAGIGQNGTDPYLESARASKDAMRELIRNERRIELCFEGMRFWDLRRWKADLNEPARGMRITNANGALNYEVIDVENAQLRRLHDLRPHTLRRDRQVQQPRAKRRLEVIKTRLSPL